MKTFLQIKMCSPMCCLKTMIRCELERCRPASCMRFFSRARSIRTEPFVKHKLPNINSNKQYDIVVVGGGIIGMATARELSLRHPNLRLAVVEKEGKLAEHQSGHNSGVVHAGIYYQPGSLKAKLCTEGLQLAYKYFEENGIPYKKCGKLIVAVDIDELPRLEALYQRALENGVKDLKMFGDQEMKEVEPNCQGIKALWSPHTGIVDWAEVTRSYGRNFQEKGGDIHFNFRVSGFHLNTNDEEFPLEVKSESKTLHCKYAVTCGGLFSDKLAEMSGCSSEPRIVPFRGEYLLLRREKSSLVRGNIYPVPNPKFPFLGVHFTPRMDGSVWLGPNAVLAFKREGYNVTDFSFPELFETLKYRGLQKLAWKNWRYGIGEMYRGFSITEQVRQLQRFVPKLEIGDVTRGPAGVRAQALSNDGNLVDDFVFDSGSGNLSRRILHIRNAPSPGATSSLAIARMVVDKIQESFVL